MPEDPEQPKEPIVEPMESATMVLPANLAPLYTDVVSVNVGFNGFKLIFGSVSQFAGETKTIQGLAMIGMSPEQTRSLYETLGRSLKTYEDQYGPIRPKPDMPALKIGAYAPESDGEA